MGVPRGWRLPCVSSSLFSCASCVTLGAKNDYIGKSLEDSKLCVTRVCSGRIYNTLNLVETLYSDESLPAKANFGRGTRQAIARSARSKSRTSKIRKFCQFHESCWDNLMKQFDREPCLERLIEVLSEPPLHFHHRTRRWVSITEPLTVTNIQQPGFPEKQNSDSPMAPSSHNLERMPEFSKAKSSFPKTHFTGLYLSTSRSKKDCFLLLPLEIHF
jgi:hypothetical protein